MVFAFVWGVCNLYMFYFIFEDWAYIRRHWVRLLKWAWFAGLLSAAINYALRTYLNIT